jgi:GNAT superfamily N-acetyltransferase
VISIRIATRDDLTEIDRVMRESMAVLGAKYYGAKVQAAVDYIAVPDPQLIDDATYYVAMDSDRIVACGGWSWRKKLFTGTTEQEQASGDVDPASDPARIRAMFVDPAYARRGIGRLILERSERDARAMGFARFELMATLPGVPLYEAAGYERVEDVTLDLPDGTALPCVKMARRVK